MGVSPCRAAVTLLVLAAGLCGCGTGAAPAAGMAAAAGARAVVNPAARQLAASLPGVTGTPRSSESVSHVYVKCIGGTNRVFYSASIDIRAIARVSVAELDSRVTGILRAAGWMLAAEPGQSPVAVSTEPHPMYQMRKSGLTGAANIVPVAGTGAEVIIFVNSRCFDAGTAADRLVRHQS